MSSASCWMLHQKANRSTNRAQAFRPCFEWLPAHTTPRALDPKKKLAEDIHRVFAERGHDFFEKRDAASGRIDVGDATGLDEKDEESNAEATGLSTQPMTPEQLFKLRSDIIPRLERVVQYLCVMLNLTIRFSASLWEK